jgi:AcrR family transcriptional regulator
MTGKSKGRRPMTESEYALGREKILAAAQTLFVEKGYRSVSMRAIAELADMSAMSIYRYFENKRAVLVQIWGEIFTRLFEDCRQAAAKASGPSAEAKAYARAFVDYWVANPENYMMVYGEIDRPVGGESFFADSETVATELAHISGLLLAAGAAEDDIDLTLQQFICAMHGVCHSLVTIPEMHWQSSERLINGLVDGLLRH